MSKREDEITRALAAIEAGYLRALEQLEAEAEARSTAEAERDLARREAKNRAQERDGLVAVLALLARDAQGWDSMDEHSAEDHRAMAKAAREGIASLRKSLDDARRAAEEWQDTYHSVAGERDDLETQLLARVSDLEGGPGEPAQDLRTSSPSDLACRGPIPWPKAGAPSDTLRTGHVVHERLAREGIANPRSALGQLEAEAETRRAAESELKTVKTERDALEARVRALVGAQ
jgi:chromosome segregation ATPase